ncbi:MAG: hypothetical protein ABSA45_05970 [Verrucomicrobiota bacterium]
MKQRIVSLSLLLSALFLVVGWVLPSWTAFTYQGRLNDGGNPANGSYDMEFNLYVWTNTLPNLTAGPIVNSAVAVTNGLFTTTLDFGGSVFSGNLLLLEVGVRTNGGTNAFVVLSPRQPLTPVPYAIFANTASNLSGSLPAIQLSGTLPASAFAGYTNTVALTNNGNIFSGTFKGTFSGNGGGVTNVNVTNLTGVLADNQLPSNTAFVNSNQTFIGSNNFTGGNLFSGANVFTGTNFFTGPNNFTNWGNSFVGSFFGNGLVGWISTNGTAVQADIDHGYLLTNSELVTVTLPTSPHVGDIVRISGAGAGGWLVQESSGQSILGNLASYRNSYPMEPPSSGNYHDVAASMDGTRMYLVGNGVQGVMASSDSGHTWSQVGLFSAICQSVACSANGQIVYVVTVAGAIDMSTDSGATWSVVSGSATTISCTADGSRIFTNNIACSGNGTNLATFNSGSISVSTNAGFNWFNIPAPSANLSCLAVSSDCTRLVTAVSNGLLYASANLGATWTSITSSNQFWSGAWMSGDGSKFAATVNNNGSTVGGIYNYGVNVLPCTISTNSTISGSQGTAVELQFIGNNRWMPVSSAGTIWAY